MNALLQRIGTGVASGPYASNSMQLFDDVPWSTIKRYTPDDMGHYVMLGPEGSVSKHYADAKTKDVTRSFQPTLDPVNQRASLAAGQLQALTAASIPHEGFLETMRMMPDGGQAWEKAQADKAGLRERAKLAGGGNSLY